MKERSSYRFIWFELVAVLTLLAFASLSALAPHSTAQQDNRQLKREQTNSAEQRRIALVIGNGAYQTVKPLRNPPNDATLLSATLRKLGFEVTVGTDKSQREMKQLIREFGQRLRGGGGVGLFYFAGHGVQARGHNYLIPVDAEIQTEADLEDVAVDVNYVLNMMDDAQNALNIAILDACRNNPFARSFRSAQEGLAQVKAPTGTLIAYATAPDSVAADGGGANSPYAEELTKQIQMSGVLLETMFRRVAEQVSSRSGGRQEPWYSANVKGDFFFSNSATTSGLSNTPSKIDAVAVEREYWETIRSSNDAQDYKDYLQAYPNGVYVLVARARLRQLEAAKSARPNTQPTNTGGDTSSVVTGDTSNASKLLREKKFAEAAKEARGIAAQFPNDAEAWKIAGSAELNLKQYSLAVEALEKALTLQEVSKKEDPQTADALAQALVLSENFARALPLLVAATTRGDGQSHPAMLYYRGLAEYKTGKLADAEKTLNTVVTANPKDSVSRYYLGQIAIGKNDLDGAISLLNTATVLDGNFPAAWQLLTSAYLRRAALSTDQKKAAADYLSAVRAGEGLIKVRTDAEAVTLFGQALIGSAQFARAAAALERATLEPGAKAVTFYLLGIALSRSRNFPKAIAALETAAQKSPADINVYRELGYALEVSKQYGKALAAYQKGLSLAPNDADFRQSADRVRPFAR